MKTPFYKYRLYLLLILFSLTASFADSQQIVSKGEIDISKFDLREGTVNLEGEWEFYNKKLLTPEDLKTQKIIPVYIKVPSLWNNLEENVTQTGKGYGTYKLTLTSLEKGKIYALNINRVQSAYKIWIDGKLLNSVGVVGEFKNAGTPKWSSSEITFKANKPEIEIVMQVSNFHHKKGGIEHQVTFGETDNITDRNWNNLALEILLLGIFLIMAAYHFAMFAFRSNDKTNLFFALTLIFAGVFLTTDGEIFLMKLIPNLNWEILIKTSYISNYLRLLFFVLFIYYSFKSEFNKTIIKTFTYLVSGMILLVLVTKAEIYTNTLIVFLALVAISLVYLIIGQIRALFRRKPGTLYSFLGILILLFTATNDILREYQLVHTVSLSTVGIFIFIIFHSYLISIQNSNSYKTIKDLTDKLVLQGKVKDALFSAKSYDLIAPLKALADAIDADRALIFIYEENSWILTNEFNKENDDVKNMRVNVFSGKENIYFSSRIVKKTISEGKYVFEKTNDRVQEKDSEYLNKSNVQSLFTYPLLKEGSIESLLYVENFSNKPKFEKRSVDIMEAVMPQISVFMDNYESYTKLNNFNEELENKVIDTAKKIEKSSNELKVLRSEIEKQNISIEDKKQKLEVQNQEINDGNKYAKKIQLAFLPEETEIKKVFPDSFIINEPREYLSGDFFWFKQINREESVYIVADSTGAGVSGALMSIIGNEIINDVVLYKDIKSPKIILNSIQKECEERFKDHDEVGGYDMSVLYYNSKTKEAVFSGAQNSIYHISNDKLYEFKANSMSIGTRILSEEKDKRYFANKRINISEGDMIYLYTDGYIKQIGQETSRKFMKSNFTELLKTINTEKSDIQKEKLQQAFNSWKGKEAQTDDVLVVGIRI